MISASTLSNKSKSWILLLILALIWGSSFILIKRGVANLNNVQVGSLRIFAAFMVMGPIAAFRLHRVKRRHLPYLAFSGFFGSLGPSLLFSYAGTGISSAVSGSLNALTPLFTLLMGIVFFRQPANLRKWAGILIGFIGALFLASGKGNIVNDLNIYALFAIAATTFYGINLHLIKNYLSDLDAITIGTTALAIAGIPSVFILWGDGSFFSLLAQNKPEVWHSVGYIVLLGLMGSAFATILFNYLVRISSAVFASSVTYLMPIVAIAWGSLDGEPLFFSHLIGLLAIVAGILLTNKN